MHLTPARYAVGIVCAALIVGCAGSESQNLARRQAKLRRTVDFLSIRKDAGSLAAASILSGVTPDKQSLRLVVLANEAAPDRADLAWLQIQVCKATPDCNLEPYEHHLRDLDPTNAAGWMGAFGRAVASKNDARTTEALVAISRSERFDVYYTVLIARLTRAAAQSKTMSLDEITISIIGALAIQAIPAYAAVSQSCKDEPLHQTDSLETCRRVAKVFENGDTYLTEMNGVAIAKRAWPGNSPEWTSAVEARRLYDYRSKA